MGNNIAGLNSTAGVTVEQIIADIDDWQHVRVLGSSRFFKVSKIKYRDGRYGVLKVFKYPEGKKVLIEKYVEIIRSMININLTNVLSYSGCSIIKETVCLWRKYAHYSLSERLSTRPFLRVEEKKWIAFQILCGLTQCHKERLTMHYNNTSGLSGFEQNRLCHGDLKTDNVMLTDWGWVLLTDMAPFKPVYMAANDPGEFYFFFDVTSKRACYLAPERFVSAHSVAGSTSMGRIGAGHSGSYNDSYNGGGTGGSSSNPHSNHMSDSNSTHASSSRNKSNNPDSECNEPRNNHSGFDLSDQTKNLLQPSMDMFSTGCLFIELFTDGVIPFNLAELFTYRDNDRLKLNLLLKKIRDENVKDMIKKLLDLNPETRITAEDCLISQRGKTFPDVFYTELKGYMVQFLSEKLSNPEVRINKLYSDFSGILATYVACRDGRSAENGTLVLFVNLITSVVFQLEEELAKIRALLMLKEMACFLANELVLDRIVPYLLEFVDAHQSAEVRRTALDCACLCVTGSESAAASPADIGFFPDYFLPAISHCQRDPAVSVQYTVTRHIPGLAAAAHKFLRDCVNLQKVNKKATEEMSINYDSELLHLRELFREMIINLFSSEQHAEIKCCLTESAYLAQLTAFFSISRARDDLLSHLITFLNDKTNHMVRLSFYQCLPSVMREMGLQSARLLETLLLPGLVDPHPRVVEACCRSLALILRASAPLSHQLRCQLLTDVTPLLCLPLLCLRLSALDYLASFCKHSPPATIVTAFFCAGATSSVTAEEAGSDTNGMDSDRTACVFKSKEPLLLAQSHMETVLWANLQPPLSRVVFEDVLRSPDIDRFLEFLAQKHKTHGSRVNICFKSGNIAVDSLYEKLVEQGMNRANESQLLLLSRLIRVMVSARRSSDYVLNNKSVSAGTGEVRYYSFHKGMGFKDPVPEAVASLEFEASGEHDSFESGSRLLGVDNESQIPIVIEGFPKSEYSQAWNNLFMDGNDDMSVGSNQDYSSHPELGHPGLGERYSMPNLADMDRKGSFSISSQTTLGPAPLSNELDWSFRVTDDSKFRNSVFRGLTMGSNFVTGERSSRDSGIGSKVYMPTAWRPRGILVGHLHEHRRGFTSIVAHSTDKQMISCGADRTLKFWNCDPTPGRPDPTSSKYIPNKSSHSLPLVSDSESNRSHCQKLVWTDDESCVVAVVDGRFVNVVGRSGEVRSVLEWPSDRVGAVTSVSSPSGTGSQLDGASRKTLVFSTAGNWLLAHDMRCPGSRNIGNVWQHQQDSDDGMITCTAVHSCHTWLVAGTSRGHLVCWDLRFQRVVNRIKHPTPLGFLELAINPLWVDHTDDDQSSFYSAHVWAASEDQNEISSWNIDTCSRSLVLRTSSPPQTQSTAVDSRAFAVRSIGPRERRPCLLAGSSDCNLRYWDLLEPRAHSSLVSHGGLSQHQAHIAITEHRVSHENGHQTLVVEQQLQSVAGSPGAGDIQPFTGHVSSICDITTVNLGQAFIATASMDGIIKLWK